MTERIEYSLVLPATRLGERLAKTISRILKHVYRAERLRATHSKASLLVSCRVDRFHLEAIRSAVNMALMARGVQAKLQKGTARDDGETHGSSEKGDPVKELRPAGREALPDS